ncbi:hypothetical protein Poly30_17530 [Planctomycetes bacterium Poly30]|uniref:Uncharacterized protein n=1 Tax=Saltatorellus ferox TaxID=2528018 RepID=A0A518EQ80_9BACT|nr:hypothetical protein Poly30_17530 [Planctomycetes bacterium Poly30]
MVDGSSALGATGSPWPGERGKPRRRQDSWQAERTLFAAAAALLYLVQPSESLAQNCVPPFRGNAGLSPTAAVTVAAWMKLEELPVISMTVKDRLGSGSIFGLNVRNHEGTGREA